MPISLSKRSNQAIPLSESQLDQNWIDLEAAIDTLGGDLTSLATAINSTLQSDYAPLASPALTGTPIAPTAAASTNTTQVATTAFVKAQAYAPLASPALTGDPTAPTPTASDNDTSIATTAFVKAQGYAPLSSPTLTGTPAAPTAATATNTTQVATTAFVRAQLSSPALTGTPTAPTPTTSDNNTNIATTAFVKAQAYAPLASPTLTGTPTAPTAATSTDTTQVATTAFVKAAAVQSGPLAGFRNAVINGGFDVWQRGGAPTTGTGYRADRWEVEGGSAQTTTSRQDHPIGDTGQYFLRFAQVVGAGAGVVALSQPIEGVRTFAGQQVTLSYRAKCNIANPWIGSTSIRLWQEFGTGGSHSSSVNQGQSGPTLTSSWQAFTHTFTLPSISGKILGTNVNDLLRVNFRLDRAIAFTLDIDEVQLELGPVATPFEHRPIGAELALCERYFQKSYPQNVVPGTPDRYAGAVGQSREADSASEGEIAVQITPMRTTPTVTVYSTATGAANKVRSYGGIAADRDSTVYYEGPKGFVGGGLGLIAAVDYIEFQYTASAEL